MSKIKSYIFCLVGVILSTSNYAKSINPDTTMLMSARDVRENLLSNITITNNTAQNITASGLFIASFDINDCSSCFGGIVVGNNLGGAVVTPVTFTGNQKVPIGQNFLYNMLYNGIYYAKTTLSSPCSLPGCTWPGDDPTVRGWCITINIISRNANYTFSNYTNGSNPPANTPAYGAEGNSNAFNYKYDLIDPNTLGAGNACLGPITCNDKTLTCKVNTPQNESFQQYS